jgi:hypothetical protein
MNLSVKILTATSLSVALIASSFTPAVAKSIRYNPSGGVMYTLEFASPDDPESNGTVRWGRIEPNGRVTPLSADLNLNQVTDADYSVATGLVYVLAEGYSTSCELWSFDPDDATESLTQIATLARPSFSIAGCESLAFNDGSGRVMVSSSDAALENIGVVNYFDAVSGEFWLEDGGFDVGQDDLYSAMDSDSQGDWLTMRGTGHFTLWDSPSAGTSGRIKARNANFHSVKFDSNDTPWLINWGRNGVKMGKMNILRSKAKWGKVLREAGTRDMWPTDAIVFIPSVF